MPERILQATPGTISQRWYEDGVPVDAGTVTIALTRADGTVVAAAGTPTGGVTTDARTFVLTTTHTALLDRLTATWTSSVKGTLTSYIEVVGGFLFPLSDLNALLQKPDTYTASQKAAVRLWAETKIEKAIGRAFVPRYAYETVNATRWSVQTTHWPVRTIRSVATRVGTTWTTQAVTAYDIGYPGISGTFTAGDRNIRIGYEHGEDFPPEDVSEAAALWAKVRLVQGPVDDRELQRFIADTGAVVNLSTPGRNSWSGIPDVDAVIESERVPLIA